MSIGPSADPATTLPLLSSSARSHALSEDDDIWYSDLRCAPGGARSRHSGPSPASAPSNPVTPTTSDYFHALTPARVLDSRPSGPQVGPYGTPWGQGISRDVQVGGQGGVPMGADAVILNVTVTNTTAETVTYTATATDGGAIGITQTAQVVFVAATQSQNSGRRK